VYDYLKCLGRLQKLVYFNLYLQTVFKLQPNYLFSFIYIFVSGKLNLFWFLSIGTFKIPQCVQFQFKMRRHLNNRFCINFKSFATTPGGPKKMPQSTIRHFITFIDSSGGHSERLLSTVTFVNNRNSTVTKSGTYY